MPSPKKWLSLDKIGARPRARGTAITYRSRYRVIIQRMCIARYHEGELYARKISSPRRRIDAAGWIQFINFEVIRVRATIAPLPLSLDTRSLVLQLYTCGSASFQHYYYLYTRIRNKRSRLPHYPNQRMYYVSRIIPRVSSLDDHLVARNAPRFSFILVIYLSVVRTLRLHTTDATNYLVRLTVACI